METADRSCKHPQRRKWQSPRSASVNEKFDNTWKLFLHKKDLLAPKKSTRTHVWIDQLIGCCWEVILIGWSEWCVPPSAHRLPGEARLCGPCWPGGACRWDQFLIILLNTEQEWSVLFSDQLIFAVSWLMFGFLLFGEKVIIICLFRLFFDSVASLPADGVVLIDPEYLKERKGEKSKPSVCS